MRDDDDKREGELAHPSVKEYENVDSFDEALRLEERVLTLTRRRETTTTITTSDVKQPCPFSFILALDVGYAVDADVAVAAGVLFDVRRNVVAAQYAQRHSTASLLPYKPGFLAFREVPLLANVVRTLLQTYTISQDDVLLLCDGNGTLHPRRCGVACHLGVLFRLPSIGVAKNFHVGFLRIATPKASSSSSSSSDVLFVTGRKEIIKRLGAERGECLPLFLDKMSDDVKCSAPVGHVLRTQNNVKPIYVSPGYAVHPNDAVRIVLYLCTSYRQPDPIRHADHIGRAELQHTTR